MNTHNDLVWDEIYSLGHEKVDHEHKKLFDIASQIAACGDDREKMIKSLKELIKYTKFHFKNEEQFMGSFNYPSLDDHIQLHKDIVDKLNTILKKIDSFSVEEFSEVLSKFIKENIINHILTVDKGVHYFKKDLATLKVLFKWKEIYKINDDMIDTEHKKLFDICIEAFNPNVKDRKQHLRQIFQELYDYMKTHFEHEEEYMEKLEYHDVENHKKLHKVIIEQMNIFMKQIPKLTLDQAERKLIEYMDIWLINHIITEDKKIFHSSWKYKRK
ncbi:MAG: bacteriohemerythrin [Campylobacterota bacterium]|nr:bacteriohemerythrin [Campylobacterota bacterium]